MNKPSAKCDARSSIASKNVLVLMYSALPEPPTLNAILVLKQRFSNVVFFRNNLEFPVDFYPAAPTLIEVGRATDVSSALKKGAVWKVSRFARYCAALVRHLRKNEYSIVIIHD